MFIKVPKPTFEQQIASQVGRQGLDKTMRFWEGVEQDYKAGGAFSRGILGLFGMQARNAINLLGSSKYAPAATFQADTLGEAGEAERKRISRRRRRGRTMITGELEPQTTKKTLLG